MRFNPYFAGSSSGRRRSCLRNRLITLSFNPYFAGSSSGSCSVLGSDYRLKSFNPYFAGSSSGSIYILLYYL